MKPENQDKVIYRVKKKKKKKKKCRNFNCKEKYFKKKDKGQT